MAAEILEFSLVFHDYTSQLYYFSVVSELNGKSYDKLATRMGQLGEFVEGQEEWQQYTERMGHFLAANGVTTEERKRSIFLSVIGPKIYKLLCSLASPNKPGDKSFASAEKSLQPQAVRDCGTLQISHLIQKARGIGSDVCLRATDSSADMQLWRFLGRYAQRPTGLWDK